MHYGVWFSETTLHESGAVKDVLDKLAERGATYEKDGAIWYRSTQYSAKYGANKNARKGLGGEVNEEEKDEVLVRANGVPTYFAADIAYHYNKFAVRGFERAIDVWGADHHGHVARMKGAMDALGLDGEKPVSYTHLASGKTPAERATQRCAPRKKRLRFCFVSMFKELSRRTSGWRP